MAHFQAYMSVMPIIMREGKILLHRRKDTHYMDGCWDLAGSGHIEAQETAEAALIRECQEEIGITPTVFRFFHVLHKVEPDLTYIYFYFLVEAFTGQPSICEPHKSFELAWFDSAALPAGTIEVHKQVLSKAAKGECFTQIKENI